MARFIILSSILPVVSVLSSAPVTKLSTVSSSSSSSPPISSSAAASPSLPSSSSSSSSSLSSSSSSSTLPSTSQLTQSSPLSSTSSPLSLYGVTVIASVALFAVVLTVGLPLICIYACRGYKRHDPSTQPNSTQTNQRSHIEIPVCDEGFKLTSCDPPPSETPDLTLVSPDNSDSVAPLPMSLSDDYTYISAVPTASEEEPIYTSADPPLSPGHGSVCDSPSDGVYSTADKPSDSVSTSSSLHRLNQLGSPEDDVYSTAELPTILSGDDGRHSLTEVPHDPQDPTYNLAELPKSPSGETAHPQAQTGGPNSVSEDNAYSLAELPVDLCNDSTYSLAQLPRSSSAEIIYSNSTEDPIYSDSDSATDPQDDSTYSTTESAVISHNPIYSVLESSTNPPNSNPDVSLNSQDLPYPATELPTNPSDDPIYAEADVPLDTALDCAEQLPTNPL
ncbi:uncharacterized protein DDB_G0271670-like [Alosa alosa]|uniref:uncharacterized protein DDB_G0271670-like n=1 Tax=Alosa alosa TaxID=278164 RepID=UPI0020154C1B|nr:uncharacterized protein DDB_G0271670-like [Alosa alosa]